ncbi:hypothetical protein Desaci_2016 [Desulfosporosinus acidiphilus SJ4]|uniref:Uncharacterized protein n=1 Tax=Desulfosporosinus acidiphilus (strain DSM 22704 / JCM 16185 / SJ4) TaxID=646529 RepID=I4D5B7_DESAJ|nr:hypothetical protein [Desulfosporosinus acidiphilus]AFM40991.1 hypothetical protein Desaci_2016 [Desulfosporosinus acidiphilus SJ4]
MEQTLKQIEMQLLRIEAQQLNFHLQMMNMIKLINQNLAKIKK